MKAQDLKNSILQLAIQGKLVEQRKEEGTAKELLEQIKVEKEQLIKDKKIKKEKSLPAINEDEIPFDIPESWEWVYINEVAFVTKLAGFEYTKNIAPNLSLGGIPLFKGKNVQNGSLVLEFESFIPEQVSDELQRSQITRKCLLTPYVGTIGNIAIFEGGFKAHLGSNVGKIEVYNYSKLYIMEEYLLLFLRSKAGYKELTKYKKATAQESISIDAIRNVIFPLPPLEEQMRIVAKMEEITPYVETYGEAHSKLELFNKKFPEVMQKSILQYAIQGKLVEQRDEEGTAEELYQQIQEKKIKLIKEGKIKKEKPLPAIKEDEIPFEIPDNWRWVRLRDLGWFSSGKTPSMSETDYWENGDFPWVTSKDMKRKYISSSEMYITEKAANEMTIYPVGTLLMVVRSGILKRQLPLAILTVDSTINQDLKAFTLYDSSLVEYVYCTLKAMEVYILKEYRKQVTTVDSLKFDEFQYMPIPIPPVEEQKRILGRLEEMQKYCQYIIKS